MQVLVIHEFWENAGTVNERRHRPGEVLTVSPDTLDLYRPFLKEMKPRREVTK